MKYPPQIKTCASSIALLGALGIAGHAQALPIPGSCPGQTGNSQTSAVISADPVQLANDNWQYSYRVCNTSGDPYYAGNDLLIDWELPYFEDAEITNVVAPDGWGWSIEDVGVQNPLTGWGMQDNNLDNVIDDDDAIPLWTVDGDPWKQIFDDLYGDAASNPFNTVDKVLHFFWLGQFEGRENVVNVESNNGEPPPFCDVIFPGDNCIGFGFESPFNAGDAPYQASWLDLPVNTGDPLFPLGGDGGGIPNSPSIQLSSTPVPEPGTLAMLGVGLPLLAMRRRRKS